MYRALQAAQKAFKDTQGPMEAAKLRDIIRAILAQVRFYSKEVLLSRRNGKGEPPYFTPSLSWSRMGRCRSSFPPFSPHFTSGAAGRDRGICVGCAEGNDGGDKGEGGTRRGGHNLTSLAARQGAVDRQHHPVRGGRKEWEIGSTHTCRHKETRDNKERRHTNKVVR